MKIRPLGLAGAALLSTVVLAGCGNQDQYKAARNTVAQRATDGAILLLKKNPRMSVDKACDLSANSDNDFAIKLFRRIPMTDKFSKIKYQYNDFEFADAVKACIARINSAKGIRTTALNTTSLTKLAHGFTAKA